MSVTSLMRNLTHCVRLLLVPDIQKREYYTTADDIILKFRRKIAMNGMTVNVDHADLAERTIQYFTERPNKMKESLMQKCIGGFMILLPDVLGQIFKTLQKSIQQYDKVKNNLKELPRMADFCHLG